jgi:hypothetical protein
MVLMYRSGADRERRIGIAEEKMFGADSQGKAISAEKQASAEVSL